MQSRCRQIRIIRFDVAHRLAESSDLVAGRGWGVAHIRYTHHVVYYNIIGKINSRGEYTHLGSGVHPFCGIL